MSGKGAMSAGAFNRWGSSDWFASSGERRAFTDELAARRLEAAKALEFAGKVVAVAVLVYKYRHEIKQAMPPILRAFLGGGLR